MRKSGMDEGGCICVGEWNDGWVWDWCVLCEGSIMAKRGCVLECLCVLGVGRGILSSWFLLFAWKRYLQFVWVVSDDGLDSSISLYNSSSFLPTSRPSRCNAFWSLSFSEACEELSWLLNNAYNQYLNSRFLPITIPDHHRFPVKPGTENPHRFHFSYNNDRTSYNPPQPHPCSYKLRVFLTEHFRWMDLFKLVIFGSSMAQRGVQFVRAGVVLRVLRNE